MKMKPDDIDPLKYTSGSKAVDFEQCATVTRLLFESRHSMIVQWWGITYATARHAYNRYLQLSPLHRAEARPEVGAHTATTYQIERYMRKHLLCAMPAASQQTVLQTTNM